MTKVKFSGIGITAMDGAIGSRVITRNFYGSYAKTRIPGPAVTSPALAAWQGNFSFVHAAYEALNDQERNAWIASARLKFWRTDALADKQRFSGFHLFMHLNLILVLSGNAMLVLPPINYLKPPYSGAFACSLNTAAPTTWNVNYVTLPLAYNVLVYGSAPMNPGRMSTNQIYTFLAAGLGFTGAWTIGLEYFNRFGAVAIGRKIWFKVVSYDPLTGVTGGTSYISGYTF